MEVPSMTMKREITVTVNGQEHHSEVEPRLLLVHYLREMLDLTGTHIGCDTSQCGACTVLLNGESVKSCTVLAVQADGCEVTTIEGLAPEGSLHPRSEEHTSELQSRRDLVCRLLLEKKNKQQLLEHYVDNVEEHGHHTSYMG